MKDRAICWHNTCKKVATIFVLYPPWGRIKPCCKEHSEVDTL